MMMTTQNITTDPLYNMSIHTGESFAAMHHRDIIVIMIQFSIHKL